MNECDLFGTDDHRATYYHIKNCIICNLCCSFIANAYMDKLAKKNETDVCPECDGKGIIWDHLGPHYQTKQEIRDILDDTMEDFKEVLRNFR